MTSRIFCNELPMKLKQSVPFELKPCLESQQHNSMRRQLSPEYQLPEVQIVGNKNPPVSSGYLKQRFI